MRRLCVFAGSRDGNGPYLAAASALGAEVARRGWGLVYGGARVGTMGALADAALRAGGEVHGVLPRTLAGAEIAHPGLTRLSMVGSMHERKAEMHALSDAFVAAPGGFGTLDEMFEAITWMQIGLHDKPLGFLDVGGYWQPIVRWIERAVADGFVHEAHATKLVVDTDIGRLLDTLVR